jgi:putative SOS response-associated peptidase YedK
MMAFMEDDWRSGKAVPTRIAKVDGKPMGVAGLWESWTGAEGEVIVSYTLLTRVRQFQAPDSPAFQ